MGLKAASVLEQGELLPEIKHETEDASYQIHYVPRGVVGGITPWNFPLSMAANKIFPPVITGNTVVLKPSPYTPLATVMLSEICAEAFPPGVVNILTGPDSLGQQIVEHPDTVHNVDQIRGPIQACHVRRGCVTIGQWQPTKLSFF